MQALKTSLVVTLAWIAALLLVKPAYALWPPFEFKLTPTHDNGKITYQVDFASWVDWAMTDVTIKIPLPAGARFVQVNASPPINAKFDGAEITLFTDTVAPYSRIPTVSFVLEMTDPALTEIAAHAWIEWQGNQPGNYLTKDVIIDLTRSPLNWQAPGQPSLQLEAGATVAGEVITYNLYVKKWGAWLRMQDLQIRVPVPEGTTFLSANAPPPFVANFDGREVSFSTLELQRSVNFGPLTFEVATTQETAPLVVTHAWAAWKNVGVSVGRTVPPQEETRTGDIIVRPHLPQQVIADVIGDVPFANYDLTSVALSQDGPALKAVFYTAGTAGPEAPQNYYVYLDDDCEDDLTYRIGVFFEPDRTVASIDSWNSDSESWQLIRYLEVRRVVEADRKEIMVWVPYRVFEGNRRFCWTAEAVNRTSAFSPKPPTDEAPNYKYFDLNRYDLVITNAVAPAETPEAPVEPVRGMFIKMGDAWKYLPGWSEPPAAWKQVGFDDAQWFSGSTGIGYGRQNNATDLSQVTRPVQGDGAPTLVQQVITPTGMILAVLPSGESGSVFIRRIFTTTNPAGLTRLTLTIDYDAGFVAYLNGVEVARRGLGAPESPVAYNTLAQPHPAGLPETIDLSSFISRLVTGTNVLAVQAHRSPEQNNLLVAPELAWSSDPADALPTPEPAALVTPAATAPPPPTPGPIKGNLAVPLDNGRAAYDVHIFSLPAGQEILQIPNARQPNFRFDGQRLLINREGGGAENVFEYNLADGAQKQVSDAPRDAHPFYDPYGNRVVYGNSELVYGKPELVYNHKENKWYYTGVTKPFIFVQCGLLPPHQEKEPRCRDIPSLGVLIPAGQTSDLQGTHPVWTSNDMIAYKGCNSWAGFAACGIYIVPSASTKGFSGGFIPRQLTKDTSDIPTDTKGNLIAFMSQRDGNWEAYVMDLNGAGVKNLSNSPNSNDGLPTLSPDGTWAAFVSDREGRWAVWAASVAGGTAQKLFDLPASIPWGDGDRDWTNERISWGP